MSEVNHSCGLMGVFGVEDASSLVWLGLHAQQHRGQEGAGIAVSDGKHLHCLKNKGLLVNAIPTSELSKLPGQLAIGHVRYPSSGSNRIQNVQPLLIDYSEGEIAIAHNGGLVNSLTLRDEYEAYGSIFQTSTDSEILVHLLAKPSHMAKIHPLAHCLNHIKGAYCFLIMRKDRIIAARDPNGIRPLCLGKLPEGGWAVASETVAFDIIGAEFVREIDPGELITITKDGLDSYYFAPAEEIKPAYCVFEHIYFSRPDSNIFGENVHQVRMKFGQILARESPVKADIVSAIPDSGMSAALGYSQESSIPLDRALIRNHYVGRSFISPQQQTRERTVNLKLNVIPSVVKNKRIILIDDSLVRGTTVTTLIKMLRQAGAREIHMRLSCPPNLFPCYYGTDFPTKSELIAANYSLEEVRKKIDADTLCYLSLSGMLSVLKHKPDSYCTACYTGKYPINLIDPPLEKKPSGRWFTPLYNDHNSILDKKIRNFS